jgi:peptidoglycan hydrolase CwlO-like protein
MGEMMSFISNLWNNKRWLFWLLLPVVILWFCKDLVLKFLHFKFDKDLQDAKKEDEKLNKEIRDIEKDASKKEGQIEEIENKVKDRESHDVDLDWHKHYKDE